MLPHRQLRDRVVVALMALFVVLATAQIARAKPKIELLFNGRDLNGWQGDPSVWSVEERAIVGQTTAAKPIENNTFLIWQGKPLGDFRLRLQYRLTGGNSGVQYRSRVIIDADQWIVGGYQADIEAGANYTGILYEERGRGILAERGERTKINAAGERQAMRFANAAELQQAIRHEDWNDYLIEARGNILRHTINGQLMSETVDEETGKRAGSGALALQVHAGPPMKVEFRRLRLTRLSRELTHDKK